jgi:hypothetical protein
MLYRFKLPLVLTLFTDTEPIAKSTPLHGDAKAGVDIARKAAAAIITRNIFDPPQGLGCFKPFHYTPPKQATIESAK